MAVAEAEAVVEVADDRNPQGEFQTSLRIPCPDRLSAGEQGFSHTEIDQKDDCKKRPTVAQSQHPPLPGSCHRGIVI